MKSLGKRLLTSILTWIILKMSSNEQALHGNAVVSIFAQLVLLLSGFRELLLLKKKILLFLDNTEKETYCAPCSRNNGMNNQASFPSGTRKMLHSCEH